MSVSVQYVFGNDDSIGVLKLVYRTVPYEIRGDWKSTNVGNSVDIDLRALAATQWQGLKRGPPVIVVPVRILHLAP